MGLLGVDSHGHFLCCLPLKVGCIVWFLLWGGLTVINVVFYYYFKFSGTPIAFDINSWKDWVGIIGATAYGIYIGLITICWAISLWKPVRMIVCLTMTAAIGGIVNAIFYWVNSGIAFNNDDPFDDPEIGMFTATTVFYCVMLITVWFQLSNIMSLCAVHKAGGTGWERKSAPELLSERTLTAF